MGGKASASAVEQNDPMSEMKILRFGTASAIRTDQKTKKGSSDK